MSVKTLLSERNLRRIDYSPYYQRNYVWDNAKQTFFIESVILGTEIPPLILFRTGKTIEVIDGRQRFETLKRFKEDDIKLKRNGLKELQILDKMSFNKLSDKNKDIFLDSNIRIYEFEIVNQPNITDETLDRIKKEIFRRYNTGITPLNRAELDNAKYDEDKFSDLFKDELKRDYEFLVDFNQCFFPLQKINNETSNIGLITKNVDFIRRYRILNSFPISTYAAGKRTEILELLYDFAQNNTDDVEYEFKNFLKLLKTVLALYGEMKLNSSLRNKLIYECILWAISILNKEGVDFTINSNIFIKYYSENLSNYTEESSHHYRNILNRFNDTARFFSKITKFDFSTYIRDEKFKAKLNELKQTEVDAAQSIEELSNLRLNKPNPISTPIEELQNDLKSNKYCLRPSYQRQEKINILKASSIIESILLGINLPPIFIFKTVDNVKEVVDGQQRILAILGFMGSQFMNEENELTYSKNNNFKLKGLKILTDLDGSNFNDLSFDEKDKIYDFVVDLIIIEERVNATFDPIDLFIRLNYKPYPIKNNSFEMWNSIVNVDIIKKIKQITSDPNHKPWFFLRETNGKVDRMLNEEMIIILSYISFINLSSDDINEVVGFFQRQDKITCRIKYKKGLNDFLINLDNNAFEKEEFLNTIEKTNTLISNFGDLFGSQSRKEEINSFLNVKLSKTFRRSLQDFYLIWLLIDNVSTSQFRERGTEILQDLSSLLSLLKNVTDDKVDASYMDNFNFQLSSIIKKYAD